MTRNRKTRPRRGYSRRKEGEEGDDERDKGHILKRIRDRKRSREREKKIERTINECR